MRAGQVIQNNPYAFFDNNGRLNNYNTMVISSNVSNGGTLYNNPFGTLNHGDLTSGGTVSNFGILNCDILNNINIGGLGNSGTLNNSGGLDNSGTFDNSCGPRSKPDQHGLLRAVGGAQRW